MKRFVADKLKDLEEYDREIEELEQLKASKDSGQMTREEFIAAADEIVARTSRSLPLSRRQRLRIMCRKVWKRSCKASRCGVPAAAIVERAQLVQLLIWQVMDLDRLARRMT